MESVELETLDTQSETLTDKLEDIEAQLGIEDKVTAVSDDVRRMFIKVRALSRSGNEETQEASVEYKQALAKFDDYVTQGITDIQDYYTFSQQVLANLRDIKLSSGESLIDMEIDGGWIDASIALYEGGKKAIAEIYKELEETVKLVVSPEEWKDMVLALMEAAKHPIKLMNSLIDMLKEYGGDTYRDFQLITENITKKGYAIEMSEFVPAEGVPVLFGLIGPGKFLKGLKVVKTLKVADKIADKIPVKKAKKLEKPSRKKQVMPNEELPDGKGILSLRVNPNMKLHQAEKFLENFVTSFDINHIMAERKRLAFYLRLVNDIGGYTIKKADKIGKLTKEERGSYMRYFNMMKDQLTVMKANKEGLFNARQIDRLVKTREESIEPAFYKIARFDKNVKKI